MNDSFRFQNETSDVLQL